MATPTHFNMENLIDYLVKLLGQEFRRDVSAVYFGDIVVYLPNTFIGPNAERKAVVAISPEYERPEEGSRTAASEYRLLGINIIVMVNMTGSFQVKPSEATGERQLVQVVTRIADFLSLEKNVLLGERIKYSRVRDIDWSWLVRENDAIRAATIGYEARVLVPRQTST